MALAMPLIIMIPIKIYLSMTYQTLIMGMTLDGVIYLNLVGATKIMEMMLMPMIIGD